MRTGMLWMAIGIAAVAWLPFLPSPIMLVWSLGAASVSAACLLAYCHRGKYRALAQRSAIVVVASVLGFCWGCGYGYYIRSGLLPVELEQQSLLLQGRVVGLVEQREGFSSFAKNARGGKPQRPTLHFQFAVEADRGTAFPHLIQLNWYDASGAPRPGERWQLRVKLKRPRGFSNPGGFDYAAWLVANRIGATGYVEQTSDNGKLESAPWYSIDALRGRAQHYLQARLHAYAHRDLLLGLLIGDGGAIDSAEWEVFRATGTVHIFVVSGLQIAFTGGLALWMAKLWWRSPWCSSRRYHYILGALPALLVALLYALLAGWGVPIQRALIMFCVLLWAWIARRNIHASTSWVAALWLVLLFDPLAVRDIGFWFSFVAVAAILLIICGHRSEPRSKWLHNASRWWQVQWALFATSLPLLLLLSGQITLLALPANFIAIPLSTLIALPLAFLAVLGDFLLPQASEILWRGANAALDVLWRYLLWLQQCGGSPGDHLWWGDQRNWAIWQALGVDNGICLFAALAALLVLLPRALPGKWFAAILLVPLFAPPLQKIADGDCVVTVIDVGQGLSVLVETSQHRLLYDTGPLFGPERAVADLTVVPLLRQRGISRLDAVVISHGDNDHAGGWAAVAREFPVRRLLFGEALAIGEQTPARAVPEPVSEEECRAGMQWHWDSVEFAMLYPAPPAADAFRGNNRSCVLQIRAGDSRILLTGDIERRAENLLLENSELQSATLLLAPHHGSRSSSSAKFIERVQPQYVVFSAGYLNRFKHPATDVMQRYRQHRSELFNTATSGAIAFTFTRGQPAQITEYRTRMRHYWD